MPRKTTFASRALPSTGGASMRPRPDAAENLPLPVQKPKRFSGFNEAAARCRGKPSAAGRCAAAGRAAPRFNEAAARCRGKPRPAADVRPGANSLQ